MIILNKIKNFFIINNERRILNKNLEKDRIYKDIIKQLFNYNKSEFSFKDKLIKRIYLYKHNILKKEISIMKILCKKFKYKDMTMNNIKDFNIDYYNYFINTNKDCNKFARKVNTLYRIYKIYYEMYKLNIPIISIIDLKLITFFRELTFNEFKIFLRIFRNMKDDGINSHH